MKILAFATMVALAPPAASLRAQEPENGPTPRTARRPVITGRSMVTTTFGIVAPDAVALPSERPAATGVTRVTLAAADSVRNLRDAKRALRRYWHLANTEYRVHTAPFPVDVGCEQQLGPYCYGPRNGDVAFGGHSTLPVEYMMADFSVMSRSRGKTRELFTAFITALDGAQATAPGDRWIMGQRVLHRVERGEAQQAAAVADRCRSDRWWCAALVGYTKRLLGLDALADSAFDVALATMPDSLRCEWEDLDWVFYGDGDRSWYNSLDCAAQAEVNRTVWWLADPLWIEEGNERRTAHYFRVVQAKLFEDGEARLPPHVESVYDPVPYPPHGPSFRTLVLKLGVPAHMVWGRGISASRSGSAMLPGGRRPRSVRVMSAGGEMPLLGLQYMKPYYHFIPTLSAIRAPLAATRTDWNPTAEYPTEHLRPRFGHFTVPGHQVAWFRQGDSAQIVAGFDVPRDTLLSRSDLVGGALVLAKAPGNRPVIVRDAVTAAPWTFTTTTGGDSMLISLEAVAAGRGAGRVRYASGPPPMPAQRVTMSDVLLLSSSDTQPSDLETATRHAALSTTVAEGSVVGLYWEVYGLEPRDSMTVSLSVVENRPSSIRKLGQLLGVVAAGDSVRIQWSDTRAGSAGTVGRSLALDVGPLGRGSYTLQVRLAVPGQLPVQVKRDLEVVRR